VTDEGRQVLSGARPLELRVDAAQPVAARRKAKAHAGHQPGTAADEALLARLKALRRSIAGAMGQPTYVVFPDRTLLEMVALKPASLSALGEIYGIGQTKLERYGKAFLDVLATDPAVPVSGG